MRILILIYTSFAVGCISVSSNRKIDWTDSNQTIPRVKVKYDEFNKTTEYIGPDIMEYSDILLLRAWSHTNQPFLEYQIYVSEYLSYYKGYEEFCNFNSAYDSEGNKLIFTYIDSDIHFTNYGNVDYTEVYGITVSKDYLDKAKNTGINFKVYGKRCDKTHYIPGGYIQGFLSVAK